MWSLDYELAPERAKRTAEEYAALEDLRAKLVQGIMSQREEILRAFIAKYGYEPDEAIQIEQRMADGTIRWYVRKRKDYEP